MVCAIVMQHNVDSSEKKEPQLTTCLLEMVCIKACWELSWAMTLMVVCSHLWVLPYIRGHLGLFKKSNWNTNGVPSNMQCTLMLSNSFPAPRFLTWFLTSILSKSTYLKASQIDSQANLLLLWYAITELSPTVILPVCVDIKFSHCPLLVSSQEAICHRHLHCARIVLVT